MADDWGSYPETILQFPEADLRIDLRLPLPPSAAAGFAALGLGGSFAVITACNPLGQQLDTAGNRRLSTLLTRLVRERYPGAREAHGESPDGRHREPGWAIATPLPEAVRVAAQFLQRALFWFDGGRFLIVPVLAPGAPLPLPVPREAR